MALTYRQLLDQKYEELRRTKLAVFAKCFEFGDACEAIGGKIPAEWQGFSIDNELTALRDKYQRFNEWLQRVAESDGNMRAALWAKCADGVEGLLFWFDSFVYTERIHTSEENTNVHIKMVLYEFQEDFIRWLYDKIMRQKPGLLTKSRDVGATWMFGCVCVWFWVFDENANFLIGSYKEEYVDGGSKKAIMPKLDYAIDKLPLWMVPDGYQPRPPCKTFKLRKNPVTLCEISGEATNENFGRGGRNRAAFFDEFAFWGVAEKAKRSAGRNARCLIFVSTPDGRGNEFGRLYTQRKIAIMELHWTQHPEWQEGRYLCNPGCKYHKGGGKPHSTRYDKTCEEEYSGNPKHVASELDIDFSASGGPLFELDGVEKAKQYLLDNPPEFRHYKLEWEQTDLPAKFPDDDDEFLRIARKWPVKALPVAGGQLRVYREPMSCTDPECLCKGTGLHTYVMGGDTAKGLSHGDADCAYMWDATLGEVVAEWHGRDGPRVIGREFAKLCKWYGTSSGHKYDAWGAVEWNGDGHTVNEVMDLLGILLHISRSVEKRNAKQLPYLGVVLSPTYKRPLMRKYLSPEIDTKGADGMPLLFCPYVEFWIECETFINREPQKADINPESVPVGGQRGSHDDRVMAMFHTLYGCRERYGVIRGHIDKDIVNERISRMKRMLTCA